MTITVEQAIACVPMWQGARDLRITPLGGGITNRNFRVDAAGGESFVLRIGGENTELLGINRHSEYAANQAAARIGIAPEVVYLIEPEGYLITRFVNGCLLPREEIGKPENIQRVVAALKQIHALPAILGTFSPFRTVEDYTATARRYGVAFPDNFDWLMARMREIEAAFLKDSFTPRPCHNDLLNENFLDDGNIRIIDWEYAGMGDVAFDLANFAVHHQLDDGQERFLLEQYYGEITPRRFARHKLM
jgi:thiamine kinase-like enzyme